MKDGSQGYDVPFSVCEHGSLKRSCSICTYQAELHEAREQLNILKNAINDALHSLRKNPNQNLVAKTVLLSALDQINGKGKDG